jgi:hypothetical protein
LCISLLGGVVRVAHGIPCRQLKSTPVATPSMGFLGAMYTSINIAWATLSSPPATSCCPPVDFLYEVWVGDMLTCATMELRFDPSYFAPAVTRSRVRVSGACWLVVGQGVCACCVLSGVCSRGKCIFFIFYTTSVYKSNSQIYLNSNVHKHSLVCIDIFEFR